MPERPRLHLDFNSPVTPPPIYSPYFTPTSPPSSFTSTPTRRSSTSSTSSSFDSPKTPSTPRIIMGAMVFTPEPKTINGTGMGNGEGDESDCEEGEMSLEVPGIVLTEPPRPPSPRLPTPPPKQVVLLAPCSLPLPSQQLTSMSSSKDSKTKTPLSFSSCQQNQGGKPQFSNTFLKLLGHPHSQPSSNAGSRTKRTSLKMILLLSIMILGVWHLWSTLEVGLTIGLVEEASLIL
ncbi:hypothetical protein L486_03297 [Kwoniella mangroviensis CBS 10435]|uniref:Uncharacterized protein n=1 Tax=Kwoniella mangroviensis CBS 10435 TaxID=1331196 RepID=A0A1B9ITG5_9TREE|nr:hypothetical protein L486_03297 [Kwoniella mangroviensis CBS 10435]OCF76943.1 hypothetical protein I204_02652 [Kwoniella mangroviensis CBS 8886]